MNRNQWLNIRPQDSSGSLKYRPGVPGVTAISIQRRLADSRFATRYFRGNGIDVGGGIDSLALYREFFPLARNIFVYDQEHGDAQHLDNIVDDSFDFLYSSHCLEHMRDAAEALENWLRVVKPGGHLVINVPDEDLYEQNQWPSRFNSDHKISFTIAKETSWSPVSINLLDLLSPLRDRAEILSLQLMDQGYRSTSLPRGIDQTRNPMAESAIEFVLRKR
ncbi:MAG: class I SAM-dependent methyltransferase [Rhodocyclaceae bacterium]|nr:class I SAM-dependent methyltransferase [Rhodocyclaceae bacterium]